MKAPTATASGAGIPAAQDGKPESPKGILDNKDAKSDI